MAEEMKCGKPVVARVFWPGREPILMCAEHARAASSVGTAMGCYIHSEPAVTGKCESYVQVKG